MKSSKVTLLRQTVHDARKEQNKKHEYTSNLYAISLGYPIPYPDSMSLNENDETREQRQTQRERQTEKQTK